jgi:hypothetical protein
VRFPCFFKDDEFKLELALSEHLAPMRAQGFAMIVTMTIGAVPMTVVVIVAATALFFR